MLKHTRTFIKHKPSITIGFLFSVSSLLLGIWVAALPAIKQRLGFSDGTLGLSLLLSPLGALTAIGASSMIFSRIKAGNAMFIGFIIQCLFYIVQVNAPTRIIFWLALFAVGFTSCLNGISANAVVDMTEKKYQRKIMSSCHGMYSLGGGVSAGLAAVFHSFNIDANAQIIIVAGIIITGIVLLRNEILSHKVLIHSGTSFAVPGKSILGLAFICFVTFMSEGSIADWSAIYLKESLHSSISMASLGFAGFSIMMAIGRFNGDVLVLKINPKKLVIAGSLIAATGFLLASSFHFRATAIAGFTLVGLGCSCIVPILFSAAANVPGISPTIGIAAVVGGGLIGFLAGPAIIGLIAEKISLATGLSFVLLLCLCSTVVATRNTFLATDTNATFIELS